MSFTDLISRLDARPGVRGRQFERICAWYLRNAPEYRGQFKKVWLWSDWPDAWAADAGIDVVAEEHDGGLWAIQAKAYDESYAIKKADVDSFLSESSRPGITYRQGIAHLATRPAISARRSVALTRPSSPALIRAPGPRSRTRPPRAGSAGSGPG